MRLSFLNHYLKLTIYSLNVNDINQLNTVVKNDEHGLLKIFSSNENLSQNLYLLTSLENISLASKAARFLNDKTSIAPWSIDLPGVIPARLKK